MPTLSQQAAVCPVGGSHYAHTFQRRRAFEGYVYSVRQREILPRRKYEEEVLGVDGGFKTLSKQQQHCMSSQHLKDKYREKPELTPKQEHELKISQSEPLLKFKWVDNFKDPNFLVPGNNKTSYKAQWAYITPEDLIPKPDLSKTAVKPQWYPKNMLEINLPRVKLYRLFWYPKGRI